MWIVVWVVVCVGGVWPTLSTADIIFRNGYETGNLSGWSLEDSGRARHAITIVKAPVRTGTFAARFELNRADPRLAGTYRNEVSVGRRGTPRIAAMNEEYWYGFSIFIPANWQHDHLRDELAQFHAPPDPGEVWRNPVLAFDTRRGLWEVWNRWDKRRIQTHPNNHQSGHRLLWTGPLKKGAWNDWVVHVKWNWQGNGFLDVWLNDVQVVNDNGPNCYNDGQQRYFKWGIYKRAWSDTAAPFTVARRVVINDGLRIGDHTASYREVAPGG